MGAVPVELLVLGEVEVRIDGRSVELGHARQRCVLAALALDASHLVSAGQLIDRVWGDRTPGDARSVLYSYLARLRRALAGSPELAIERRPGGYSLTIDPLAVDLHRFRYLVDQARRATDDEALSTFTQALDLWRGEPFAGLDAPWLDTVRTALIQERVAAELDHIDLRLHHGEHAGLLAALSARARTQPLDERVAGQYMLALYCSGRPADALTHYQHIRHQLADELGADPGPALQKLHEHILRNDPSLRATTSWSAPLQPPKIQQLPACAPHFVGRAAELARLTALLDNALNTGIDTTVDADIGAGGTVVISAIGGAGGIGKTWLAVHWAHQHLDRFPDGQLFVDLRGFTPTGDLLAPEATIRGFLDAFGVHPRRLPPDPHAQAALFRSVIAGRRMLLVLDNAADASQVMPLLPDSPTCTVLITSRRHLTGLIARTTAHHVALGALSDADARQALIARLGTDRVAAESAAVTELLGACAGFPLALSIVASRAILAPGIQLAEMAAELRDATTRLVELDDAYQAMSLPAVLSWSLRTLTDEQTRVFGLLGIAPGPDISLPAAASLTGLSHARTAAVLRTLEQASLLDRDRAGRFHMHELVRLHACEYASRIQPEPERDTAIRRVVDFYLHTANSGNQHLLASAELPRRPASPAPGCHPHVLTDGNEATAWLDTEYHCLLACQHTAIQCGWHATVWHLAWALTHFQYSRGHLNEAIAVWQAGLASAQHLADSRMQIVAHRQISAVLDWTGRRDEAREHVQQALTIAEKTGDTAEEAATHNALAFGLTDQGAYRHALHHSSYALRRFQALGKPIREAHSLSSIGWCLAHLREYDQARTHCQNALAIHHRHHHPGGEADALHHLGYIEYRTENYVQAIIFYEQALAVLRPLGMNYELAEILYQLGHPHIALRQLDQAELVWREALELYQAQGLDIDVRRIQHRLDNPRGTPDNTSPDHQLSATTVACPDKKCPFSGTSSARSDQPQPHGDQA